MRVERILKGSEEERRELFEKYSLVKWVMALKNGACKVVFFSEDEDEIPKVSTISEMIRLLGNKRTDYVKK